MECIVCAGPFFVAGGTCWDRIPKCLIQDSENGSICKKCEFGYGWYEEGKKCVLGMEGCIEFENENLCKKCEKSCPNSKSKNSADPYNWRYFGLTNKITIGDKIFRWCVEGCLDGEFEEGTVNCLKCAKYSDSNPKIDPNLDL